MNTVSSTNTPSTEADQFRGAVEDLMLDEVATGVYVERARDLIEALGSRENPKEFAPQWYTLCKARFDAILSAMLRYSIDCGGKDESQRERSERYVACAINACTRGTKASDDTHRALSELAISWFGNLLWIFKGNSYYKSQTVPAHSGEATPTLDNVAKVVLSGAPEARRESMRLNVLKRQGFKCPLTGVADVGFQGRPLPAFVTVLQCAHILKRTVAVFPPSDSISEVDRTRYRFAMSTLDILAHYMAISHDQVLDIVKNIDSPANGIAMQSDYHIFFDSFRLCLEPTDQANVYQIKFYTPFKPAPHLNEVIFRDPTASGIPLPNPAFLSLHAALCGVLHMSGAGEDIDNIVRDLKKDGEGRIPEPILSSGFEFLQHMEARESVRAMMGGTGQPILGH